MKVKQPVTGRLDISGDNSERVMPSAKGNVWFINMLAWDATVDIDMELIENGSVTDTWSLEGNQEGPDYQVFYPNPIQVYKSRGEVGSVALKVTDKSHGPNAVLYVGTYDRRVDL